jgi:hypothetical protein
LRKPLNVDRATPCSCTTTIDLCLTAISWTRYAAATRSIYTRTWTVDSCRVSDRELAQPPGSSWTATRLRRGGRARCR